MTENSDQNSSTSQTAPDGNTEGGDKKPPQTDQDLVEKLVSERLEEKLQPLKDKLDKAYTVRDEALRKAAEYERKEKEENLKRLQEEGKHKEAYELQLAEERAARQALEKRNTELTRDIAVRNALSGYDFRNDKANDMAFLEITNQLIKDEHGNWIHKSGITVKDFVKSFVSEDDNAFLFKVKSNSGSGNRSPKEPSNSSNGEKSLFERSQTEVLQMAKEGKLPQRQ
jgi:hypothetical protein